MSPPSAASALVDLLEEGYRRKAWHGPNLSSALRGVGAEEAAWSPGAGRPSIWALTLHCAYWKRRVVERVSGTEVDVPRLERDWSGAPTTPDDAAWRADRRLLGRMHREILDAVGTLSPADLGRPGPGQKRTRIQHLRGVALHDIYHAGQIRLLRKLYEEASG